MHIFFADFTLNATISLSEEESFHAAKVLRLRQNQEVMLTDGKGAIGKGLLVESNHKESKVEVFAMQIQPPRPISLHVAIAPTKNIDRFEWFLEKATECGIDAITPIYCEQSERSTLKPERLKKILVSAMKQSLRAYMPLLNPETKVKEFVEQSISAVKMIAHCGEGTKRNISDVYHCGQNAVLMIGPEGDFTPKEIHWASNNGYQQITLGEYRLRTETAALAGCIKINSMNSLL